MADRYDCIQQAERNLALASSYQGTGNSVSRMVTNRPVFTFMVDPAGVLVASPGTEVLMVN